MTKAINDSKNNIFKISSPYYLMYENGGEFLNAGEDSGRMIIFFGANFKDLPGANWTKFVEATNQGLNFIRREFPGYELYYKSHPAETDEPEMLNLEGIEIIRDSSVAEFFLWKNSKKIKCVFSVCSGACMSAYYMGFNSYIFPGLLETAVDKKTAKGYLADYFEGMPANFFIKDLNQKTFENKKIPPNDPFLEKEFSELFNKSKGNAWFIIGDPNSLVNVILLTRLIRKINPSKRVNLIIMKHHRWEVMNIDDFKNYFDEVRFFPRIFYSLRPQKIINAIKTALFIKSLKMLPDDILIGFTYTSFVENCFLSFNKKNVKIAILPQSSMDFCCYSPEPDETNYRTRKSFFFWRRFLEPILGLEPVIFREDRRRIRNFSRFRKPLNDVYSKVYLLQSYS